MKLVSGSRVQAWHLLERRMVVVKLIFLHSLYICDAQWFIFLNYLFYLLLSPLLPPCSLREVTIKMTPFCEFALLWFGDKNYIWEASLIHTSDLCQKDIAFYKTKCSIKWWSPWGQRKSWIKGTARSCSCPLRKMVTPLLSVRKKMSMFLTTIPVQSEFSNVKGSIKSILGLKCHVSVI